MLEAALAPRLKELNEIIRRDLPRTIEQLGVAAAVRFARQQLRIPDTAQIVLHGKRVPDVIYVDKATGRVTVIEAKGGEATLGVRLSINETQLVQQGTYKYLESLAQAMQQSGDDRLIELGKALALALRRPDPNEPTKPNVGYYLVRQPFVDPPPAAPAPTSPPPLTASLAPPRVATFDIRLDDRDRDPTHAPRTRP